ncbi:glucose-1-phosphate adenylyltransferase family protein [Nocardioides euryhalodurans]|uniref:Glucose-1-phosphate adenylyltransferase n=1 Tax=Nocardioides euryhalodurans TaxID=2518370 RepID=A0A4P7GI18_9ACTN|nr:sugar phosphate nucleotidyltransferase [Nocardioides euryhalodurans]QBR91535.1 glucose-1-phosphate adenylyltransferase [Nocardioides euryhalodurans]
MGRTSVLAIIQAGGAGNRMDVLTRERPKPALPVAGVYQLVDFALSSLSNSGIDHVWLSVQYHGTSLEEQVANGRPWDLDRTRGGLRLLMPEEGTGGADEDGFARGNADELYRVRDQIAQSGPEVLLVMSADHVYRYDFADLVDAHLASEAECTVVTTEVPVADAPDHAVVSLDGDRVVGVDYKPEDPDSGLVAAEIFAYRPDVLVEVLEQLHRELGPDAEQGDSGLGDFGEHLLPRLVERGHTHALPLAGYWRDLGQPHYYLRAHQELIADDAGVLNDPAWPILTRHTQRGPARLLDTAQVTGSLVSSGCVVGGRVERSVLGPGVVVHRGAHVSDSVIFADVVVAEDARVAGAIVDKHSRIGEGARVGSADADLDDSADIVLVGRDSAVAAGERVPRGARLEPGSTAGHLR